MGFISGFLGGITVTSAVVYISMAYHRQARLEQAMLLRQSFLTYRSVYDPQPELPLPTAREERTGIAETAKDKWNAEVANVVRRTHDVDWDGIRDRAEDTISALWSKAFERTREEVEKRT